MTPELAQAIQGRTYGARWFGVKAVKNPVDFWTYQEIVFDTRPQVIVEIGNASGGSLLAFAHLLDGYGEGRVIGVDREHSLISDAVRKHPRISLVSGDAVKMAGAVEALVGDAERVLVIEDSSHEYDNTLSVLRAYAPLVKPGCYLVCEDTICRHGLDLGPSPGPYEAVDSFLAENPRFERDRDREWPTTWNPGGFLRRKP